MSKQYAERDASALDEAGGYYIRHVSAMTKEGLHSKSDIAAELGYRDMLLDSLGAKVSELLTQRDELQASLQRLISSDPHIEMFPTSELEICANNDALPPTLREQAASVIQARAVIAMVKGGAKNHFPGAAKMVPDGWQLVPVEPTSAMLIAAGAATPRYRAMLAAAPKTELL